MIVSELQLKYLVFSWSNWSSNRNRKKKGAYVHKMEKKRQISLFDQKLI